MQDQGSFTDLGLPHGPGFRFVDQVTIEIPGKKGSGTYRLRGDEAFLEAHFPGNPMMPGVLMIEAMAQISGVLAQSDPEIPPLNHLRLTAVRGVKILGAPVPGETMRLEAEIVGRMGHLIQASGKVLVGDRTMAEGQITLSGQMA